MTVWILTKGEHDGSVMDVFMSPEAAQSRHKADDWKRDEHNVWRSEHFDYTITKWEAKG